MAVYAIGDLQGCLEPLERLLARIRFQPGRDRLWFAGDLVNRGPHSARVLRFVRDLGASAVTVLGNHDLHLLAVAAGARALRRKDTVADVLEAADGGALLEWLRQRPLVHRDADLDFAMVHAGIPPAWNIEDAERNARAVEAALRGPHRDELLRGMYGDEPADWDERLSGWDRLRYTVNALTRLRYCDAAGRLVLDETGPPSQRRPGLVPWFEARRTRPLGTRIVFGHWATLDLDGPPDPRHGAYHVDTGCVWGRRLTALRLEDARAFSVPCARGPSA